jgi:hypothetical protein
MLRVHWVRDYLILCRNSEFRFPTPSRGILIPMLITLSASISAVLFAILTGLPIALWITRSLFPEIVKRSLLTLATALIAGFALSAIAASWSYGVTDIDWYLAILISLLVVSWALLLTTKLRSELLTFVRGWEIRDLYILFPVIMATYLARSNWKGLREPVLVSGSGPDTAQNLMAAQSARTLGSNWADQASRYLDYVNQPNLRTGVMELFRLPSFREQAGVDYLVYGTRWGLTVPYSQVLRYFGNSAILWETGVVLLTSLISLSIVVFASTKFLARYRFTPLLVTLTVVANTPFLVQYFNGGLSQAWALVGNAGIFLSMIISLRGLFVTRMLNQKAIVLLIVLSWISIAVTYIDSAIVISLLLILMALVFSIKDRQKGLHFIGIFALGGVLAALLVPAFTYASLLTFDLRLKAASGTGVPSQIWPLPSELLGFVNIFSSKTESRSSETLLIAIILSTYFLYKLLYGLREKKNETWVSIAGVGVFVIFLVGFLLSISGPLSTNYIYLKVATYVAPLGIILVFIVLEQTGLRGLRTRVRTSLVVPTLLSLIAVLSSVSAQSKLSSEATTIPHAFSRLLDDEKIQRELSSYNYLAPYLTSSNLFGIFGNVHWISKAPNDILIGERINSELRLICFASEPSCIPKTPRIASKLEQFGILIFQAGYSTADFMYKSPKERFDANFLVFGQQPQKIPDRFIGGNPYFND